MSDKTKALDAARAFIERVGMQILDLDYPTPHGAIAIVALDAGVFVHIAVFHEGDGLPAERTLKKYRARMRDYMAEHHLVREVRYDSISINVIASDRALLRHHRDVGGGAND